jgi:hypothetical protein
MRKFVAPVALAAGLAGAGLTGAILGAPSLSGAQSAPQTQTQTQTDPATKPAGPIDTALSKLVADGTLTQAQADKVEAALKAEIGNRPFGHGGPGGPGMMGHRGGPHLDAAAKALGTTTDELRTQLESGKALAQVAKDKGVDPQKVIDAIVADENAEIDQAVKDGKLTQAQADEMKSHVTERVTNMVDNGPPAGGPGRHHHMDGPPPAGDGNGGTAQDQPSTYTS